MTATRRCGACQRPNGPHFARCMSCGEWLGMLDEDDGGPASAEDAARRAVRLLEGMTPQRRSLLPAQFLRSVQIQASGVIEHPLEDAETDPGIAAVSLPPEGAARILPGPPSAPPAGPHSARSWLPSELSLDLDDELEALGGDGSVLISDPRLASPTPAPPPLGAWRPRMRSMDPQPPPPPDDPGVADEPLDDRTSAPGLLALDIATASELCPLPEGAGPLVEALSSGRGPFGPREARRRVILLPHAPYRDHLDHLKQQLKAVLGLDLYTGALFLQRTIPTHLASEERGEEARKKAEALRRAGLRVVIVDRERWLEGTLPRVVVRLRGAHPGAVTFTEADGHEIVVDRSRFDALILGEITDPEGGRPSLIVDIVLTDEPTALRLRAEITDFPPELDGPPRERARKLAAWLPADSSRPLPIDDAFRGVPVSARSVRSAAPRVSPAEGDFTEYSLLVDLGRRLFGP